MRESIIRLFVITIFLQAYLSVYSQESTKEGEEGIINIDSLKKNQMMINDHRKSPEIVLSPVQSVTYLKQTVRQKSWIDSDDPFRRALGRLIFEASNPPYDSTEHFLKTYPYDSLNIPWDKFYIWKPLKLKIPAVTSSGFSRPADSVFKSVTVLKDTTLMVVSDTLDRVGSSYPGFPFSYSGFPFLGDSIQVAVKSLLRYLEERDSSIIYFSGAGKRVTPVWLNSRLGMMTRFWLKNEYSDSVTVWIGNPSRDTINLYLEQGVNLKRPVRQGNYAGAKVNIQSLDKSKLLDIKKTYIRPQYWKYHSEESFILSQAALANWVRGGENSISTSMDITYYADYTNKPLKLSSNNFARIKLGFLASGDNPIRKNIDLLETNSKLNHRAFGKFDFSGILLFKTQIARGYNYPNDSVPVSKFMNPFVITVGLGLDYKPNKETSINFSPLSYKGTFVPDIDAIDQTIYGIPKGRTSLNEPGVSFMITNEYKPVKNVTLTNRLQLFTNYIHNPQNIDVDWEMIAVANLNWFTDVRFNTHFIFDDDTRTTVIDKNKKPVMRPDGTEKKTARIQFKEILGFSFVFRF